MQLQIKLQKTVEITHLEEKRTSKKAAQNIVIGLEVGEKVRLTF